MRRERFSHPYKECLVGSHRNTISIDMRVFEKPKAQKEKSRELMLKVDNIVQLWRFVVSNMVLGYAFNLVSNRDSIRCEIPRRFGMRTKHSS